MLWGGKRVTQTNCVHLKRGG